MPRCVGYLPPRRFALALGAVLALAGGSGSPGIARAAPDLTPPWPQEAALTGIAGKTVAFPSHSPFTLADVGQGARRDPPTTAQGTLFLPRGISAADPAPAVVMLHGASGVLDEREMTYGRQLSALGVAALVVDSFGARRDRGTRFIDRLLNITETMILADAYAALRYLASRPEIDGDRVVLVGFSYGGMAATYAAFAQVAEALAPRGERFAGHVAYYAPCIAEFKDGRATGAPLLLLYGGKDGSIDPARCAALAAKLEAGGGRVETIVYPGALHQWDGRFGAPRMIGRNLADCRFHVSKKGQVSAAGWPLQMTGPFSRKMILGFCAKREGYMIGRDDSVRERSNADLAAFLETVFTGPGAPGAATSRRSPLPQ